MRTHRFNKIVEDFSHLMKGYLSAVNEADEIKSLIVDLMTVLSLEVGKCEGTLKTFGEDEEKVKNQIENARAVGFKETYRDTN